jgi:hypothetical protein
MITENTKLARLIGEVLRLSDYGVESDERWAGVAELRQLLEGTRIEYSVPRQKDVCKHGDRRRSRAAGPQIGGKMAKMPIWHRCMINAADHPIWQRRAWA